MNKKVKIDFDRLYNKLSFFWGFVSSRLLLVTVICGITWCIIGGSMIDYAGDFFIVPGTVGMLYLVLNCIFLITSLVHATYYYVPYQKLSDFKDEHHLAV